MMTIAATPFAGLLAVFILVPLGIMASVYGAECAVAFRRRPSRPRRP